MPRCCSVVGCISNSKYDKNCIFYRVTPKNHETITTGLRLKNKFVKCSYVCSKCIRPEGMPLRMAVDHSYANPSSPKSTERKLQEKVESLKAKAQSADRKCRNMERKIASLQELVKTMRNERGEDISQTCPNSSETKSGTD